VARSTKSPWTTLPASFGINLGWQATDFQKVTARYDLRYDHYGRVETTPEDFITPTTRSPTVSPWGNGFPADLLLGSGSYARRADWEPWATFQLRSGDRELLEYRFVGKDFFFKTFHKPRRCRLLWRRAADRFTKYQFGLFDETRAWRPPLLHGR
jgi:hypothetical protein